MTAKVRVALFVAASLFLFGAARAQTVPGLTKKQKTEKIKAPPDEERKWLTDYVAPIILPDEENLFLQLTTPYQREMFKAEFWKRREQPGQPPPFGPGYHVRYEHFRDVAATEYDGISSDAGRMVVRLGEPAGIEDLASCGGFRQAEVWSYQSATGSSTLVRHLFYRPNFGGPRRLWLPGDMGIFETLGGNTSFDLVCAASRNSGSCACALARIASEISGRGSAEVMALGAAPKVSTEGLNALWERLASVSDPNAKTITLENTQTPAPPPPLAKEAQAAPVAARKIPAAPRSDRLKALPDEERKWLTEYIAPIILPEEEVVFLDLSAPYQREEFKKDFWQRRER